MVIVIITTSALETLVCSWLLPLLISFLIIRTTCQIPLNPNSLQMICKLPAFFLFHPSSSCLAWTAASSLIFLLAAFLSVLQGAPGETFHMYTEYHFHLSLLTVPFMVQGTWWLFYLCLLRFYYNVKNTWEATMPVLFTNRSPAIVSCLLCSLHSGDTHRIKEWMINEWVNVSLCLFAHSCIHGPVLSSPVGRMWGEHPEGGGIDGGMAPRTRECFHFSRALNWFYFVHSELCNYVTFPFPHWLLRTYSQMFLLGVQSASSWVHFMSVLMSRCLLCLFLSCAILLFRSSHKLPESLSETRQGRNRSL